MDATQVKKSSSQIRRSIPHVLVTVTLLLGGCTDSIASTVTTTTAPAASIPSTPTGATGIPSGAIAIDPGNNIQAIVDRHPAGTTFYLRAGLHSGQGIEPRDGDTFIGEPGAVLDGDNLVGAAFRSGASDVTIQGLVIENYASPAQQGAISSGGSGWHILDNEIRFNAAAGIDIGPGARIEVNNVHHNHQIGVKARGADVLVEGNEIAFNNWLDEYETGWEAGGTKFLKTTNLVVRNNHVHDNHGNGLWTDHENIGTLYENNLVENNTGNGIFHEISYDAVIRFNTVTENGNRGIRIASSSNVEIHDNVVAGNSGGVFASQSDRGTGSHGPFEVRNLWVHDNQISYNDGFTGLRVNDNLGDIYYTGKNNRFDRNEYKVGGTDPFFWMNQKRSPAEWVSHGQDPNGTFN